MLELPGGTFYFKMKLCIQKYS